MMAMMTRWMEAFLATWTVMGPLWWATHTRKLVNETSEQAGPVRYRKMVEFILIGGPLVMLALCAFMSRNRDAAGPGDD